MTDAAQKLGQAGALCASHDTPPGITDRPQAAAVLGTLAARRRPRLAAKRALDIAAAALLLVLVSPLLVGCAVAIRATSPGPVLFRQARFGLMGRSFEILKFRTMYADRGDVSGRARTVEGDGRVTPLGRVLRRTCLDELPQLWNVLRGDMSLVGPRAHAVAMEVCGVPYHQAFADYHLRHLVRPGMTGWAQVNRCRGEVPDGEVARWRLDLDLYYVSHQSLWMDLEILARTVAVVASRKGAV